MSVWLAWKEHSIIILCGEEYCIPVADGLDLFVHLTIRNLDQVGRKRIKWTTFFNFFWDKGIWFNPVKLGIHLTVIFLLYLHTILFSSRKRREDNDIIGCENKNENQLYIIWKLICFYTLENVHVMFQLLYLKYLPSKSYNIELIVSVFSNTILWITKFQWTRHFMS